MTAGPHSPGEPAERGPSLVQAVGARAAVAANQMQRRGGAEVGRQRVRLAAAMRTLRASPSVRPWLAPAAVALLLAPAAITWAAAEVLIRAEAGKAARIRQDHANLLAVNAEARHALATRARIAPIFTRPTIGVTAARLAEILPPDADLRALGIEGETMTLTIAAPDPDRLREVLGQDARLGRFREVDQRDGGDGRILIGLRGPVR